MADHGHQRSMPSLAVNVLNRTISRNDVGHDSNQTPPGIASHSTRTDEGGHAATGALSIEQSIKMFRMVELLRSNNIETIDKAIDSHSDGLEGTTMLHLAIQVAEPSMAEHIISNRTLDINAQDRDGNTPLHLAAMLGRLSVVRLLLAREGIDSSVVNYQSKSALDLARTPEISQQLQLERAMLSEAQVKAIQAAVRSNNYGELERLLENPRVNAVVDVNSPELASDLATIESGGNLLHQAARNKDVKLIQLLLLNGADPFRRDRKGRLAQDITKDDKTRAILKRSPAATVAQRGVQEKAILGSGNVPADKAIAAKESREMKGYLKKWTNYTAGYKLRWFVLEDGVLSYYKHQEDAGSACRGAMNMRIAKLSMNAEDKTKIEIEGKSSVRYFLKANHNVEAKRWFWALNNAIQWSKDEAREERQRQVRDTQAARRAISEHRATMDGKGLVPASAVGMAASNSYRFSVQSLPGSITGDELDSIYGSHNPGAINDTARFPGEADASVIAGDMDDYEEYGDDASDHELHHAPRDAFNITAHSANLQLQLLAQVSSALQAQIEGSPETKVSESAISEAIGTYEGAVRSLQGMVRDLLKIARDRESYWQSKVEREADMRRLWEESMANVAREHEELEGRIGESEEKRKRTKKALREALGDSVTEVSSSLVSQPPSQTNESAAPEAGDLSQSKSFTSRGLRRRSTIAAYTGLSDSDSDGDEEFFDAVGAGEVPVEAMPSSLALESVNEELTSPDETTEIGAEQDVISDMVVSFKGYEDPVRERLALDADNRPAISLWGILKSMIGKDMTKMTLPVSFNEPTSLLQRVAEDMEYTDLLDTAANRVDSTERMVYVATFAASEYASTIGRVAKPFNPLLGETYEYARPDKGYRFVVEQVSHHPPIGAAWADSRKWTYYGESAVKSRFTGKSFDINPLGTWFLKLRPASGGEELYTWKKANTTVVGIITGSPTVDNYGPMEIKNWTTGEVCLLDFKPRGWKASSAYQVTGKVSTANGTTRWSVGGRWNDKIYARLTPGFEGSVEPGAKIKTNESPAFLVWQANPRPNGIPFNLTPFSLTLNALPDKLRPMLPPTDTRLRPDQRAMEDGDYDRAATEKNRVEEKQRAKRRAREASGEEFVPRWFSKARCEVSGEEFWRHNGEYWKTRARVAAGGQWERVEEIF